MTSQRTRIAHLKRPRAVWLNAALALPLALALAGCATDTKRRDAPPEAPATRADTSAPAAHDGKVLGGMKRGTDAAGRGLDRAGDATLGGVNRASEAVSSPLRRWGESFGRVLDKGPGGRARDAGSGSAPR